MSLAAVEVTTTADESDIPAGAEVSLREAMRDTPDGGTVTFAPTLAGATIEVAIGSLPVSKSLILDASALAFPPVISGLSNNRHFTVGAPVSFTLRGLALADGTSSSGGSIFLGSGSSLTLEDCRFENNHSSSSGGAIHLFAPGEVMATDCRFIGNSSTSAGGAIYATGTGERSVTLSGCEFTANEGGAGGAVYFSSSNFEIDDCLFDANHSSSSGGGLNIGANASGDLRTSTFVDNRAALNGGGLALGGTSTTVSQCTFAGNLADFDGGGIHASTGSHLLEHLSLTRNQAMAAGGGLANQADTQLHNTLVAGNASFTGGAPDLADPSGLVTRSGNNLIGDPGPHSDRFPPGLPNALGDYVGSSSMPLAPLLDGPGDFGGTAPTCPPLPGSPAIDRATTTLPADQRSLTRPQGAAADIGAAEWTPADGDTSPADGADAVSRRTTLGWLAVPDAASYEIHLGAPGNLSPAGESTTPSFSPAPLEAATTFEWKVVAMTPGGPVESPTRSFTTRPDLSVTRSGDLDDPDDGGLTLREAIAAAADLPGWDRIAIDPSLGGTTLSLDETPLSVSFQALEIDGSTPAGPLVISGGSAIRLLGVSDGADVELSQLEFRDAADDFSAGAVRVTRGSRVGFSHCGFFACAGNALLTQDSEVVVESCHFEGNETSCSFHDSGTATVRDSTFLASTSAIRCEAGVVGDFSNLLVDGHLVGISAGGPTSIVDSTLRHCSGQAISNFADGELTLSRCTLGPNEGTAVQANGAVVIIDDCLLTGNEGRAIFGPCRVTDSTFSANSVSGSLDGGAIYSSDATIERCLFLDNTAGDDGGAVDIRGGSITNSTFTGNQADVGGAIIAQGEVALRHLTVTRNRALTRTGGVELSHGPIELSGCVIAANYAPDSPDVWRPEGLSDPLLRQAPNLVGIGSIAPPEFPPSEPPGSANADGDYVGSFREPIDPLLSPLADFGGRTACILPLPGSPALDRVDPSVAPPADQRGIARPQGTMADIGAGESDPDTAAAFPADGELDSPTRLRLTWLAAGGPFEVRLGTSPESLGLAGTTDVGKLDVELEADTSYYWQVVPAVGPAGPVQSFHTRPDLVVTTAEDVTDPGDGLLSLREAVDLAGSDDAFDRVRFAPGLDGETLVLQTAIGVGRQELAIDGPGVLLSGNQASRIFEVSEGARVECIGLGISGGMADEGGAIRVTGVSSVELVDCELTDNSASEDGGAVWMSGQSRLIARGSRFANNGADEQGGAVYVSESNVRLRFEDCVFEDNHSGWHGGAVAIESDVFATGSVTPVEMIDCRLESNVAGGGGGAIALGELTRLAIEGCHFHANAAGSSGGAIFATDGSAFNDIAAEIRCDRSVFSANRADSWGGVLYSANSSFLARNCTFSGNASTNGGACYHSQGDAAYEFCTIHNNDGGSGAGGIQTPPAITLQACLIAGNGTKDLEAGSSDLVTSLGDNFIGNYETVEAAFPLPSEAGTPNANGDLTGSPDAPLDPLLRPLADHGGPGPVHLFLSGSPARDQVGSGFPATDQRGIPRPQGAAADIGAAEASDEADFFSPSGETGLAPASVDLRWSFVPSADFYRVRFGTDPLQLATIGTTTIGRFPTGELDWGTTYHWQIEAVTGESTASSPVHTLQTRVRLVVDTAAGVIDAADGLTSLPEAVLAAEAAPGIDSIIFAPSLAGQSIVLAAGLALGDQMLVIDAGELTSRLSISGPGSEPALALSRTNLRLRHLDFPAPPGATAGAIVADRSSLYLEGCGFSGHPGSAVRATYPAPLELSGCSFANNGMASLDGGAVWADRGTLVVDGSEFTGNRGLHGGAIRSFATSATIRHCRFVANQSSSHGGALALPASSTTLDHCEFRSNQAFGSGGAVDAFSSGPLHANANVFLSNGADVDGGALRFTGSSNSSWFANSTFHDNSSGRDGGGCLAAGMIFHHCTLTGNRAGRNGGGLHSGSLVSNSIVAGNLAASGTDIHSTASVTGVNLIGSNDSLRSSYFDPGVPNRRGQFAGSDSAPLDPRLAPLDAYAGTPCRPPLPGSPAIGKAGGSPTYPPELGETTAFDQAGLGRPFGSAPDIGAVEARPIQQFGSVDSDGDGIDDRIEPALGLVVGNDDRNHDTDGDGQGDGDELESMTDPFDPGDLLRVVELVPAADFDPASSPRFTVRWKSVPGIGYQLLSSAGLSGFAPVPGTATTAAGPVSETEVTLPAHHRFIQVATTP